MPDIKVRAAELADLSQIVDFNLRLAAETEDKQLDVELLTAGVQRILQDASKGAYFVAVDRQADSIVGQIMFTREWSDWRNGDLMWIQSVYVSQAYRRTGVFRLLLKTLQQIVEGGTEFVGLRLYVEKDNTVAQKTYNNLGFVDPGYLVLEAINRKA